MREVIGSIDLLGGVIRNHLSVHSTFGSQSVSTNLRLIEIAFAKDHYNLRNIRPNYWERKHEEIFF